MAALLLTHAVVAVVAVIVGRRVRRRVFLAVAVAPLVTLVWAAIRTPGVLSGASPAESFAWVGGLGLDFDLRLNGIGLLMTYLISAVGALVLVYAYAYFDDDRAGLGRFAATLTLFTGSMYGLVWSDNLLGLFVFWELTSVCSYLLIGFDDRSETARNSALQALLITGAGGLALLLGTVLIGTSAGTFSITAILAEPPRGAQVSAGAVLVLVGAFTKSAQVPFHGWLPGAMAAPTPVSAYLHSATMVKAGVYVVALFSPAFADVGPWRALTLIVGSVTMLWGAYQSLRARDLKLVLAHTTVAALGSMIALFGLGSAKATFAAVGVLLAHAIYKAALFMVVGIVDHSAGTRDIHRLRLLRRRLPAVAGAAALAAASMAAVPATLGFVTKEAALEGLIGAGVRGAEVLLGVLVCFSALTAAAAWRFWRGAFGHEPVPAPAPEPSPEPVDPDAVHRAGALFAAPAAVLAVAGVVFGILPQLVNPLVAAAAASLDPAAGGYELYAFAGFNEALALSALALGAAAVLVLAAGPLAAVQRRLHGGPGATAVFRSLVAGLLRVANWTAGFVQNGSLPVYLAVVLLTFAVVPGVVLAAAVSLPEGTVVADSPLQAVTAAAVIVFAVAGAVVKRRFAAALMLGAVGYLMAVVFVLQGAPDLALTQFLVETVIVVAFVLVLRRLPEGFSSVRWRARQVLRLVVSAAVGLVVFGFLISTGGPGPPSPVEGLAAAAPTEGGGSNVVNVILTDIRALDTLGETAVVAIAGLGVLSLTSLAGRRRGGTTAAETSGSFLGAESSPVLDTAVRATLPLVAVLSVFLLMAGHNAPGGGFVGGLVAAAGLVLRSVAQPQSPPFPWERVNVLVGGGLLVAVGVGCAGWLFGSEFLDMGVGTWTVPVFGTVKATGALLFDIGVYAVVVGTMVAILQGLGGERPGRRQSATSADARARS